MKLSIAETIFNDSLIHLSEETEIIGELRFAGNLQVDAKVSGKLISESGAVVINKQGHVKASVEAGTVEVHGVVEGTITAKKRVQIHSGGRVYGDIYTPALNVEPGALFDGKCHMLEEELTNGNNGSKAPAGTNHVGHNGSSPIAPTELFIDTSETTIKLADVDWEKRFAELDKKYMEAVARAEAADEMKERAEYDINKVLESKEIAERARARAESLLEEAEEKRTAAESRAESEAQRRRDIECELTGIREEIERAPREHVTHDRSAAQTLPLQHEFEAVREELEQRCREAEARLAAETVRRLSAEQQLREVEELHQQKLSATEDETAKHLEQTEALAREAVEARAGVEAALEDAEKKRSAAEEQARLAERAVQNANAAVQETEEMLNNVKKRLEHETRLRLSAEQKVTAFAQSLKINPNIDTSNVETEVTKACAKLRNSAVSEESYQRLLKELWNERKSRLEAEKSRGQSNAGTRSSSMQVARDEMRKWSPSAKLAVYGLSIALLLIVLSLLVIAAYYLL